MATANILIVEDELIIGKYICMIIEDMGYNVTSIVSSGEKAFEQAEMYNPDMVLMDIGLRGIMDGIMSAQKIQNQLNIPVVLISGYTDEKTMEKAMKIRPYGFLQKPVEENELNQIIESVINK